MRAARILRSESTAGLETSDVGEETRKVLEGSSGAESGPGHRTPSTSPSSEQEWPRGFGIRSGVSHQAPTSEHLGAPTTTSEHLRMSTALPNIRTGSREAVSAALEAAPLFRGCSASTISKIVARARYVTVEEGQELVLDDGDPLYVVASGALTARVGSGNPATLAAGSVLNVVGMLGGLHAADAFKPRCPKENERLMQDALANSKRDAKARTAFVDNSVADATGRSAVSSQAKQQSETMEVSRCIQNLCPHAPSQLTPETCGRKCSGWLRLTITGGDAGEPSTPSAKRIPSPLPWEAPSDQMIPSSSSNNAVLAAIELQVISEAMSKDQESQARFISNRDLLLNMWRLVLRSFVFPGAPLEVVWAVIEVSRNMVFNEDELVVEENDTGDIAESLLVVGSGEAIVEKLVWRKGKASMHVAGSLSPGSIIGNFCFIGTRVPSVATVRARTPMVVLEIPAAGMRSVLARYPGITACFKHGLRETVMQLQPSLPARSEALTMLKLFSESRAELIYELAKVAERRVSYCGDIIKRHDHDDGALSIVEFGACGVEVVGIGLVHEAEMGTCIGERSLLGLPPTTVATVRVTSPMALLLVLPKVSFDQALKNFEEERSKLHQAIEDGVSQGCEISKMEVLRRCSKNFVEAILQSIEMRCYMPGQTVTVEGNADSGSMFVIKGGRVFVQIQGKTVAQLHAGAAFGELAMLGVVRRRTATIMAATHVFTFEIPRASFLAALDKHPEEKEHCEQLTMRYSNVSSKSQWPIFQGGPKHLLYLVNFYTDRCLCAPGEWVSQNGEKLTMEGAVQVLQGTIKVLDTNGKEVGQLSDGSVFNEQILIGLQPTRDRQLVPKTVCEVQIMTKKIYDTIIMECPGATELVEKHVLEEMVMKSEQRLGLPRGGTHVLRHSALFRAIPEELLEAARAKLDIQLYRVGETLVEESAPGDCMFWVVDGQTTLRDFGEPMLGTAKKPQSLVFGESNMLGVTKSYPYSVQAETDCLVLKMSTKQFKQVLSGSPEALSIFRALGAEVDSKSIVRRLSAARGSAFAHVGHQFTAMACRHSESVFFAPNEEIVRRGDPCRVGQSPIYCIVNGEAVVVTAFDMAVHTLSAGDVFGEGGGLGIAMSRNATVRAGTSGLVHCTRLSPPSLKAAIDAFPNTYEVLVKVFEDRQAANAEQAAKRREWVEKTVVPNLTSSFIFAQWPDSMLFEVALPLHAEKYAAGTTIVEAGDAADSMLVFLEGEASVGSKYGDVVGRVKSGASVGETALLGLLTTRTATIKATADCEVLAVPSSVVRNVLARPQAEQLREFFEQLIAERCQQVADGTPLCSLNLGCGSADVCVRAVALHAERLSLVAGERWLPLPDSGPYGPHVSVVSRGRCSLVIGSDPRPVTAFKPGTLVPEGVASDFCASMLATMPTEAYRIRMNDFLLSVHAVPSSKRWFAIFVDMDQENRTHLRSRLQGAKGALCARRQKEAMAFKDTGCGPSSVSSKGRGDAVEIRQIV